MKKIFLLLLVLTISMALTACNNEVPEVNESGETILTMWVHIADDTLEGKSYKKRADDFNEEYEGLYEVRVEYIPRGGGGTGYEDRVNAALTTGGLPDVLTLDGPNTAAYAKSRILLNLDDYITQEVKDDFLPSALEQGMYEGSLYSLAIQESTVAIYYNKDLFVDAGLCTNVDTCESTDIVDPTTGNAIGISIDNPWTFDEFLNVSRELTAELGIEAINLPIASQDEMITYSMSPFIWTAGGNLVSPDGYSAEGYFNSTESQVGFEFLQQLINEDLTTNVPVDNGFYIGSYPMSLDGAWGVPILNLSYADTLPNWGLLPYPIADEDADFYAPTGSWAFGVTSTTNHPEGASLLAEWMTNAESTLRVTAATGLIPSRYSAFELTSLYDAGPNAFLKEQLEKGGRPRPSTVGYPELTFQFQVTITSLLVPVDAPDVKETIDLHAMSLETKLQRHAD